MPVWSVVYEPKAFNSFSCIEEIKVISLDKVIKEFAVPHDREGEVGADDDEVKSRLNTFMFLRFIGQSSYKPSLGTAWILPDVVVRLYLCWTPACLLVNVRVQQ